jgi:hypothetical protein
MCVCLRVCVCVDDPVVVARAPAAGERDGRGSAVVEQQAAQFSSGLAQVLSSSSLGGASRATVGGGAVEDRDPPQRPRSSTRLVHLAGHGQVVPSLVHQELERQLQRYMFVCMSNGIFVCMYACTRSCNVCMDA